MMLDYHCIVHKLALVTSQSSYVSGKQIVDSIKVKFIDQLVQRPRIIIYIVDIFCSKVILFWTYQQILVLFLRHA